MSGKKRRNSIEGAARLGVVFSTRNSVGTGELWPRKASTPCLVAEPDVDHPLLLEADPVRREAVANRADLLARAVGPGDELLERLDALGLVVVPSGHLVRVGPARWRRGRREL